MKWNLLETVGQVCIILSRYTSYLRVKETDNNCQKRHPQNYLTLIPQQAGVAGK